MLDEDEQRLKRLCQVLNDYGVEYIVFGSFSGRLQGAPLETVDVDVVPEASDQNLQRLCDALNSLEPRWRIDEVSQGLKIDGGQLEPRHIRGSSVAIGLVTKEGLLDIVLEPRGFEAGYNALVDRAVTMDLGGTTLRIGAIPDLIQSKRLLDREKDREHLPLLVAREAELERQHALEQLREHGPDRSVDQSRSHSDDDDLGLGL